MKMCFLLNVGSPGRDPWNEFLFQLCRKPSHLTNSLAITYSCWERRLMLQKFKRQGDGFYALTLTCNSMHAIHVIQVSYVAVHLHFCQEKLEPHNSDKKAAECSTKCVCGCYRETRCMQMYLQGCVTNCKFGMSG